MLFLHDTEFKSGDVDLDAPGALAELHRRLALDESRNTLIADDVAAALTRGRNCLVLTRRVAHVEALTAMLSARGHRALVLQGACPQHRSTKVSQIDTSSHRRSFQMTVFMSICRYGPVSDLWSSCSS